MFEKVWIATIEALKLNPYTLFCPHAETAVVEWESL